MNKRDLVRTVAAKLKEKDVRKHIYSQSKVFHISDDEGNSKDFVIKHSRSDVMFSGEDVEAIIDSLLEVVEETLAKGEDVSIHGFGTFGLKYRKPRSTKIPKTDEWVDIDGRYIPKFSFGNKLRMSAKLYELSLEDKLPENYRIPEEYSLDKGV